MEKTKYCLLALLMLIGFALYGLNASWLAPAPNGQPYLISHRGVYQMYNRENIGRDDCTANRIHAPRHDFIENTLPSMRAAFDAGADALELDIHPTSDGEFVVFHDWTLDCRTDGTGVTRAQTVKYLKSLDVGYGYTADGGQTFPLRGKGKKMMPTLSEVYRSFPDRAFILNIKSNDPREAGWLIDYLKRHGQSAPPMVYGGEKPLQKLREHFAEGFIPTRQQVMDCTKKYIIWGWSGWVPAECEHSAIMVPLNRSWLFWGWPNRFLQRMKKANSRVLVMGSQGKTTGIAGIEHESQLDNLPPGFDGYLWIEAIESIGPLLSVEKSDLDQPNGH